MCVLFLLEEVVERLASGFRGTMSDSAENNPIELGIQAQQAGQWKQALRHYTAAIEAEPGEAFGFQLRGSINLELGRFHDALRDFDQAILLSPYSEIGYMGKGHTFVGLKDYRWAVIQFTNAIDVLPEDAPEIADLYLERATAYELLGDRVSAEKDRQRASLNQS